MASVEQNHAAYYDLADDRNGKGDTPLWHTMTKKTFLLKQIMEALYQILPWILWPMGCGPALWAISTSCDGSFSVSLFHPGGRILYWSFPKLYFSSLLDYCLQYKAEDALSRDEKPHSRPTCFRRCHGDVTLESGVARDTGNNTGVMSSSLCHVSLLL